MLHRCRRSRLPYFANGSRREPTGRTIGRLYHPMIGTCRTVVETIGRAKQWINLFWRGWRKKGWHRLLKPTRQPCCAGCLSTSPDCRLQPRKKQRIWRIPPPTLTKNRWIVCWLRHAMANAGRPCGWTWHDMRIQKVTKRTGSARESRSEEHTSELQSRENLVCR